ncbi:glycoside hydrolase superfamily [Lentinula aciculospora]|uniref:Glycoside hydrolase superfamily n=1 Tax=Lentinula aciculospora TaxID=153920 RepID=A0A9W9AW60_9AGAR|nr:glycoside hydrolase superfamily [Lentinula aciculospora]
MRVFTALGAAIVTLLSTQKALGAPIKYKLSSRFLDSNSSTADNTTSGSAPSGTSSPSNNSIPSIPHYIVYNDEASTPAPDPQDIQGFNVLNLAFILSDGKGADVAAEWEKLSDADRKSVLQKYNQAGIKIMVSAFGSTETPTTQGLSAETLANTMAEWVIKYGVHGIDVDYEDFAAINGKGVQWIVDFTNALRLKLPQGQYILTHAPVAPWFTKNGPYLKVHQQVGDLIDWYNVQFYNQGNSTYNTCENLVTKMSNENPALLEIIANGVPMEKLVIGKPAVTNDASNGFISPTDLGNCLAQAKKDHGYNSGAMTWEYHTDGSSKTWIEGVLNGRSGSRRRGFQRRRRAPPDSDDSARVTKT